MEESNVAIRLKGFIDSRGLSHSQFADECGIPRPSLSQILSGRNKKISDVIVGQIHKAFPSLSILWLLFAEGDMLTSSDDADGVSPGLDKSDGSSPFKGADPNDEVSPQSKIDGELALFFEEDGSDELENAPVDAKISDNEANANLQSNLRALKLRLTAFKHLENELVEYKNKVSDLQLQIENYRSNPRKVSHITVYYDDSTFETFMPK